MAETPSIEIPATIKVVTPQVAYCSITVYGSTYEHIKERAKMAVAEFFGPVAETVVRDIQLSVWSEDTFIEGRPANYRAEAFVTVNIDHPF